VLRRVNGSSIRIPLHAVWPDPDTAYNDLTRSNSDIRGTFRFAGADFVIVEPFGDNSRYWIGPADDQTGKRDIASIEASLRSYRPPILRKVVGDLITLNFRSLLGG
jgi:hypothetical protein